MVGVCGVLGEGGHMGNSLGVGLQLGMGARAVVKDFDKSQYNG